MAACLPASVVIGSALPNARSVAVSRNIPSHLGLATTLSYVARGAVRMPIKRPKTFIGAGEVPLWTALLVILICQEKVMLPTSGTNCWDERLYRTLNTSVFDQKFPAKLTAMNKMTRILVCFGAVLGLMPSLVHSQTFPVVGTRAQGMGGAFVGVADDGTAIYWNPAGLAAGSYFSAALDHSVGEPTQQGGRGGDSKNTLIGVSMPALGLGYYRLEARSAVPPILLLPVDEVP